jgi:starvation-inducible DNA-binding protein
MQGEPHCAQSDKSPAFRRIQDNDVQYVDPLDRLAELCLYNQQLALSLHAAHTMVEENRDIATASLIETWIDETKRRLGFLFESSRHTGT